MSHFSDRKPASQSVLSGLFGWSRTHLYLSPANVLAAVIALVATANLVENIMHMNQLELGMLALPFITCLDILFIALVASLFVRRPNGFVMYLGFVAILIVPEVASIVLIDVLRGLSGVTYVPNEATSRLIESSSVLVLSLIYFWDIVNRMREAQRSRTTS